MTVFDLRQGVRDFFGWLLCWLGLHKWSRWYAEPELSKSMGMPPSEFRWCERDSLCGCHTGQSRPADREGGER